MLVIGERINATRRSIREAIKSRDMDAIVREAKSQIEAGANYLDVNCGTVDAAEEPAVMQWLAQGLQQAASAPLCIDSANPEALSAGLAVCRGPAMINSISAESERFSKVLPLITEYRADVVALCMDDKGIPPDSATAEKVGRDLVRRLLDAGVPADRIYVDPLVRSVATNPETVMGTLDLMQRLAGAFDGIHFVSGLSNVSFGLPERRHLNRAYVVMSVASGLDAVIMDPLDRTLQALIYAAEALANKDRFCMQYIGAYNEGKLSAP
ncbi:MAG: dihydropteroate synthase [Deltaproteobacteria bacterium]